jgi:hypothetical protein
MPFTVACPNCGTKLTAPDSARGQKVRCKKCDEKFLASPGDDEDARPARPLTTAARSYGDTDEDEAPPRKPKSRRRTDDDEDDEDFTAPRRRSDDEDDESSGKGKKAKKKKKGKGPPVLPIVMGVAGTLLIAVVGLVIYYAIPKSEKPPDGPVAPEIKPLPGFEGGVDLTNPQPKGPTGPPKVDLAWIDYTPPDGTFTAKLPKEPTVTNPTIQGPNGQITANLYTADTVQVLATVIVFELPGVQAGEPAAEQALDKAANLLVQRLSGAKLVGKKAITYQGNPAREVGVDTGEGGGTARLFLANGRVYGLVFAAKSTKPDAAAVRTFFDGFKPQ